MSKCNFNAYCDAQKKFGKEELEALSQNCEFVDWHVLLRNTCLEFEGMLKKHVGKALEEVDAGVQSQLAKLTESKNVLNNRIDTLGKESMGIN